MELPARGDIVVVVFPFSDLGGAKPRPALVVGEAARGDRILCQITSKDYHGDTVEIDPSADMLSGALRTISYVRPLKLFTASSKIIRAKVGRLADEKVEAVAALIVAGVSA